MDPVTKTFLDIWGAPGLLLALALAAIAWLLRRLLENQDKRIEEGQQWAEKYGQRLSESSAAARELTTVVNAVLARFK